MTAPLPPGQRESDIFHRFGLTRFAERFPKETSVPVLAVTGAVSNDICWVATKSPRCWAHSASVWMDEDENVSRADVWLGAVGAAPMPVDATSVLAGKPFDEESIAEIAHAAHKVARPMDNTDHAPSWRGKMTEQYVTAALREVAGLPQQRMRPRHMLMVV